MMRTKLLDVVVLATTLVGCSNLELDPAPAVIHARFDPDAGIIPMPSDVLRNKTANRLDLPNDTDKDLAKLNPTEIEFYNYLETLDGWSSLMAATVEFTGPIDPRSITPDNLQVWHWTGTPERVMDVRFEISADAKLVTIDPPRTGWRRGDQYAVVLRGGASGATGKAGEKVECDAAFYFLRQVQALDTPEHAHAIPGATPEERKANTDKLEGIRKDLLPLFDALEAGANGMPQIARDDVAALWQFTVTTRTELAMDKASQRMPLPIDLMISPETHHVDVPIAPWDGAVEAEAKPRLADFDGFGLSSEQMFEFTAPVDPKTISEATVKLYRTDGQTPVLEPATVTLHPDMMHVILAPKAGRLAEKTNYAIYLTDDVRDATGQPIVVMPAGHFMRSHTPILADGASTVHAVDLDSAKRLETAREELAPSLDGLGRDHTLAAWPFRTMSMSEPMIAARKMSETLAISPEPSNVRHLTPAEALADFPFGIASTANVSDVYYGTIKTPVFLDKQTRGWRGDGGYELTDVDFAMTIPKNPKPGPIPVVIFGHGLVTERRFVLALGDALAAKGFAAISIDFPYHGNRTYCATGGPISIVNPLDGSLQSLPPCQSGSTCNDEGRCVDASGQGNHLATFGVISTPIASGAMFNELDHIANSKDHFEQALIDLGSLDRSLRQGNWQAAVGHPLATDQIYYAGQSLGGIMGGLFLGTNPDIKRAVLNVPGAGLVDLFNNSTFFAAQMNAFFTRLHVDRASPDGIRLFNVAKWFLDAVDPQHLGPTIVDNRSVLLQMATLDFIIPNDNTKLLQTVTGARRIDYTAEHGFIVIPLEPEYYRGTADMAKWLNGEGI